MAGDRATSQRWLYLPLASVIIVGLVVMGTLTGTSAALLTLAAVVVIALVELRIYSRRQERDLVAGVTTALLVVVALILPLIASSSASSDPATLLACFAVALIGVGLASTEWLRRSLRIFGVVAILALGALTYRVGYNDVAADRCRYLTELKQQVRSLTAEDVVSTGKQESGRLADIGTSTKGVDEAIAQLKEAIPKGGRLVTVPGGDGQPSEQRIRTELINAAQRLLVAIETQRSPTASTSPDTLPLGVESRLVAFDRLYAPAPAVRAERKLARAADRAVRAFQAERVAIAGAEIEAHADEAKRAAAKMKRLSAGCRKDPPRRHSHMDVLKAEAIVATFKQTAKPNEANKSAAEKAASVRDAFKEARARGEQDPEEEWTHVLEQGAEATGAYALKWLPGSPQPDKWFWIALGVALLLFWWWIERRSNSEVAGPVVYQFTQSPAEEGDEQQVSNVAAVFAGALTKNFREPGTTPGSAPAGPTLTDLEELVTVEPGKVLAQLIKAVKAVFASPRGSFVSAQLLTPPTDGATWRVWTRVSDAATGRPIASKTVEGDAAEDACQRAGYWAAAAVLNASPRFPLWSKWSPSTAEAFAVYDAQENLSVEQLRNALTTAPATCLMLQKLGDELSLEQVDPEAAELYARAVSIDPDYDVAVYRLGAILSALSRAPGSEAWTTYGAVERQAAVSAMNRAFERLGMEGSLNPAELATDQVTDFRTLASELFHVLGDRHGAWASLTRYFRRDLRDSLGPLSDMLRPFGRRARMRAIDRSAALTVCDGDVRAALERTTLAFCSNPLSGWHSCYNLACYYALESDDPVSGPANEYEAVAWLEAAMTRPGVEQLSRAWLRHDPDLILLEGNPSYERLIPPDTTDDEES